MVTRRQFLKAGLVGGIALAGVGAWYGANRALRNTNPAGLTRNETAMMTAVATAILGNTLPAQASARKAALDRTVEGIGKAVRGLSAAAQKELDELFGLLDFPPSRGMLTGVWGSWENADPAQVDAFLSRWRHSRLGLFRSAYAALHDLVYGAWYGEPESWPAIGYPGPPQVS